MQRNNFRGESCFVPVKFMISITPSSSSSSSSAVGPAVCWVNNRSQPYIALRYIYRLSSIAKVAYTGHMDGGLIQATLQPPNECFWSGAGDRFVGASATSGGRSGVRLYTDQWVWLPARGLILVFYGRPITIVLKCTELGTWDRQTDIGRQMDGSQHCYAAENTLKEDGWTTRLSKHG